MRSYLRRISRPFFRVIGRDFIAAHLSPNADRALRRMARLAQSPQSIIDVGASDGRWSDDATRIFPLARPLLVEAQAIHQPALRSFVAAHPGAAVELCAASNRDGELHFRSDSAFGGVAAEQAFGAEDTTVPCATIDTLVRRHALRAPYFLKLDTHGHEAQILEGARETLQYASLVMIEAYTLPDGDRLLFWELCAHMQTLGFRPAGLSDPQVRPIDGLLWQMDLFFLPASHAAFRNSEYGKAFR